MWFDFALAFALTVGVIYLPGTMLLAARSRSVVEAIVLAPLVSIPLLSIVATAYSVASIPSTFYTLFLPVVIISFFVFLAFSLYRGRASFAAFHKPSLVHEGPGVAIAVTCGLVLCTYIYIYNLDGADSFYSAWDNAFHLNYIARAIETGNMSLLQSSVYTSLAPTTIASGFYPSASSNVTALVVTALNCPITLAQNASSAVFCGMVYPVSMYYLVRTILPGRRRIAVLASIAGLLFAAFPWHFLVYGPLLPNLAAFALLPAMIALFLRFAQVQGDKIRITGSYLLLFIVAIVGMATIQPNAVFSAGVFLAPYIVLLMYTCFFNLKGGRNIKRGVAAAVIAALVIAIIWFVCYKLPFLQATVTFSWAATSTMVQALVDALLFQAARPSPQLLLAVFTLLGVAITLRTPGKRWLCAPFFLTVIIYVIDAGSEGELKHILSGFWYTDPRRIAGMLAIFATPLAATGLYNVSRIISHLTSKLPTLNGEIVSHSHRDERTTFIVAIALFVAMMLYPSFSLGEIRVETGIGAIRDRIEFENSQESKVVLDGDERQFLDEVSQVVSPNALVLNNPNDGSVFAYATNGLNIYYRSMAVDRDATETDLSRIIRTELDDIADSSAVQDAVAELGAEYVLLLDVGDTDFSESAWPNDITINNWPGFMNINDQTDGLEIVLRKDDMRLYRIAI